MPYTTVVAGTTISSSVANTNWRDQVVSQFASASARDSAITSPVAGMVCYTSGDDTLWRYNGSKWIRQRRCANLAGFSTTSVTFADVPGLSWTADANSTYAFDMWLSTVAPTAADLSLQWVLPASATIEWGILGPAATNAGGSVDTTIYQGTTTTLTQTVGGISSTGAAARVAGTVVTAATSGTCKIQAAQAVASGTSFIRTNSWFALEQTG